MGVTIHYRGQLRDSSLIGRLVEELRLLAQQKGWEYTILDDPPEKQVSNDGLPDLRGIVLLTTEWSECDTWHPILVPRKMPKMSLIAVSMTTLGP
jgi:hypothetical protein